MDKFELYEGTTMEFCSPIVNSYKFGYYNFCPFDESNKLLLAHKIFFEGRMPNKDDQVEVGYFDFDKNGKWVYLDTTSAFNWQQGSMLQWLPTKDGSRKIIFNTTQKGRYIAKIIDIDTNVATMLNRSIYAIDPKGKFALGMNFERSHFTRAYSYAPIQDEYWNEKIHPEDFIYKIDINSKEEKRLFSINDIIKKNNDVVNDFNAHWFEHIMLNRSGTKFAFYHRYGSASKFETSVFTADNDGNNIWHLQSNGSERYTHLGWLNDEEFTVFTVPLSAIQIKQQKIDKNLQKTPLFLSVYRKFFKRWIPKTLVKKVVPKLKKGFYSHVKNGKGKINSYFPEPIGMDGHPSFTKCGRYMLSDTYADQHGYRHLLLYSLKEKKTLLLGRFYSKYNNCGWRGDLHPRFSRDEQKVIIDSTHNGKHQMLVLKINWGKIYE
tara:strand:- start:4284 stop:5588 length:1305 start_codon:yes stop_codon:yes gene_type:complete